MYFITLYHPRNPSLSLEILLEASHKGTLFLGSLEATMSKLAGRIDELELDLLEGSAAGVLKKSLAEDDGTLLGTRNASLDHQKVLLDLTIVREATHGVNGLGSEIKLSRGSVGIDTFG